MVVVPSVKVTVPVGVPAPETAATEAVNVTDWPNVEGLTLLVNPTAVVDWLTAWLSGVLALPEKFRSPP